MFNQILVELFINERTKRKICYTSLVFIEQLTCQKEKKREREKERNETFI